MTPAGNTHTEHHESRTDSPSASSVNTLTLADGRVGFVALIVACVAAGAGIALAVTLPALSRAQAEAASAAAIENARIAEREARIATDRADALELGLAKKGIYLRSDGH